MSIEIHSPPLPHTSAPFTLLTIGDVQAAPKEAYQRQKHEYWTLEFVISGLGTLETGGNRYTISAGHAYLLRKHEDHHYYADAKDPWHKLFINCDGPLIKSLLHTYNPGIVFPLPDGERILRALKNRATAHQFHLHDYASLCFHELLIQQNMYTTQTQQPAAILQIQQFIDSHLTETFNMDMLTHRMHMSAGHLSRFFKKHIGQAPSAYHQQQRLKLAADFLTNSNLSVKQISEQLGYSDPFYFSGVFKKAYGRSPSGYRK